MSNSIDVQRRCALDRCAQRLAASVDIPDYQWRVVRQVLSEAWQAGYVEADRDTGDAEFDRRVEEINRERDAIESGCHEPCPIHCVRPCCNPRNREP